MVHTYNGISLSHKKEWNNTTCNNMGGPRECQNEWSISEKDKYGITYMQNQKIKGTSELIYKTEVVTDIESKLMVTRGWRGRGINWEIGIDVYTFLYTK